MYVAQNTTYLFIYYCHCSWGHSQNDGTLEQDAMSYVSFTLQIHLQNPKMPKNLRQREKGKKKITGLLVNLSVVLVNFLKLLILARPD
jgi:hypothetical protein